MSVQAAQFSQCSHLYCILLFTKRSSFPPIWLRNRVDPHFSTINIRVPYYNASNDTNWGSYKALYLRNWSDPHPLTIYILVFLMIRQIQWHWQDHHRGIPPPPPSLNRPTSLKVRYLRNHSYTHPLTIYICVPYDKMHPMTLSRGPSGGKPHPFHFINISETTHIPTP